MNKWKRINTKAVWESKWLSLWEDDFELPDGKISQGYYRIERSNIVVIFALNESNELIVEKQYRRGIDEVIYELPAGEFNDGELVEEAAEREFLEETGYSIRVLKVQEFYPLPAYIGQKAFIVFCKYTKDKKDLNREEDEFIETTEMKLEDIEEMVKRNEIKDASMLLGLYFYDILKPYE